MSRSIKYNQTEEREFITRKELKSRGWSGSLVNKFLRDPDKTKRNPFYRSAAPMKLYDVNRVENIESTDQFIIEKNKLVGRFAAAQKAIVTKTKQTMKYVKNEIEFKITECIPKDKLIDLACESYNRWKGETLNFDGDSADVNSNPLFIQRICVNYLRHEITDYDYYLEELHGKVGIEEAYIIVKNKALNSIAEVYPWLAEECKRQSS